MPTLHILMPDGSSREEPLDGEVTVGRADGNTVVLTEGGVSRRHARFYVMDGGKVMVEDLGSANGTFVDGEQVAEPTEVGPRAQVVIGDYEISVKSAAAGGQKRRSGPRPGAPAPAPRPSAEEGSSSTRAVPPVKAARATRQLSAVEREGAVRPGGAPRRPAGASGARDAAGAVGAEGAAAGPGSSLARRPVSRAAAVPTGPTLRGLTGPWANKLYPIRGSVVIGRVAGVQIQIEDESVSRRHAELERTADGVILRDLGSANGTTVNGQPVEEDTLLQAGDVVSVGMIELSYEVGDEEAMNAPTRGRPSGARGSGSRRAAGPAAAAGGGGGGKKRLLIVAGAVVGLLAVAGVVSQLGGGGGEVPADPNGAAAAVIDPRADVERLLAECRSFAATDTGTAPNWEKARVACEKARELDPINRVVIELVQKIDREQECKKHYDSGERLVNLAREEEALEEFAKIDEKCSYYRTLKPRAREAIETVKKKAGKDCKEYASAQQWELALPRCERFMTIACQKMAPEQLTAPVGYITDVAGSCRGKRNCWTPKDPMYRNLLLARVKVDPGAGPWMCPPIKMFDDDLELSDPRAEVRRAIRKWYQDALVIEAMELYFDGKGGESFAKLQRLRTDRQKAALHPLADELRRDIGAVENLYRIGSTNLKDREFDKAKEAFTEALAIDAKLMRDMVEKRSFYRTAIETEVAKEAYLGGKHWADRGDPRRACRIWKLGFGFFRGNGDLNRAAGFCSDQGAQALAQVGGCGDLQTVLDFAVDGDGLKQRAATKAAELGCPGATAAAN